MRIARVLGSVTLGRKLPELPAGALRLAEVLDAGGVRSAQQGGRREKPEPEALVVFDELGAGEGQLIAVSESREASMPFYPAKVPIDAYAAAILDSIDINEKA